MPNEPRVPGGRRPHDADPEARADALKERIYVTFTSLAVVIALSSHLEAENPGGAATTLALTAFGTVLAVFVADVLAHLTVHGVVPSASEMRHMMSVSFGALTVIVVPLVLLGLAALEVLTLATALLVASVVLIATLGIVTLIAMRRLRLDWWKKGIALAAIVVLGALVLVVEIAVH